MAKLEKRKCDFAPTPISDDMVKTDIKLCRSCRYFSDACMYYLDTGKNRGCPVGWCNKYEKGKRPPSRDGWKKHNESSYKYSQAIAHQNDAYFREDGDN